MKPMRWPVRVRLTALYAGAFLAAGAVLVGATYWLVSRSLQEPIDTGWTPQRTGPSRRWTTGWTRV